MERTFILRKLLNSAGWLENIMIKVYYSKQSLHILHRLLCSIFYFQLNRIFIPTAQHLLRQNINTHTHVIIQKHTDKHVRQLIIISRTDRLQ